MSCTLSTKFIVFQHCLCKYIGFANFFFHFDIVKFISLFIMDSGLFSTLYIKGFLIQKDYIFLHIILIRYADFISFWKYF